MANVLTFLGSDRAPGPFYIKRYQCVVSGSYVNGGAIGVPGETLSFNTSVNTALRARAKLPANGAGRLPANADFRVVRNPEGYVGQIERNATSPTPNNFAMRIFAAGSGAANPVEIASGAYLAALIADPTGFIIEVRVAQKYV